MLFQFTGHQIANQLASQVLLESLTAQQIQWQEDQVAKDHLTTRMFPKETQVKNVKGLGSKGSGKKWRR